MQFILATAPLLLHPITALAAESGAANATKADPWGIVLFVGVVVLALGWFIWRIIRAAKKEDRK